jgi:hypothetical protein
MIFFHHLIITQMTEHSITVTRALVELKTLDKRIKKACQGAVFISYKCGTEDNAKQKITENRLQQITDLVEYRKKLKAAIAKSNASTVVTIAKKQYTVAAAIEYKSGIDYEKSLLNDMKAQLGDVTRQVENFNERVQSKLDGMMEKSFSGNQKTNPDELKSFGEAYLKTNRAIIVDPLQLAEKCEKLEDKILEFEAEVDLVLSESNATTKIVLE